jgi:tetratricopeptide (TPR) repeat protein
MAGQIFVSYAHADPDFAFFLQDLSDHLPDDFHIWTDEQITPGRDWKQAIDTAILESFAVLVILTPRSSESKYVTYEWSFALGVGRQVITLLLDEPDDIHPRLKNLHWLDFSRRYHEPWVKLTDALTAEYQAFRSTGGTSMALELLHDGRAKRDRNDLHNALDTLVKALDFAPDHLLDDIHYEIAAIYREIADSYRRLAQAEDDGEREQYEQQTEENLVKALQYNPKHVRAMVMLGELHREQGDREPDPERRENLYVNAEAGFRAALDIQRDILDESRESVWASLGGVVKRRGDIDRAIEYYKRAAQVRRTSYPFNNLGLLYMQKRDVQRMRSNFKIVRLLADNRIKHQDAIDDYAYNDFLMAQIVLDDLDAAATTLDTIELVAKRRPLGHLLSTLEGMTDLPGAPQATLDFIADAQQRIRDHLAQLGGQD